MSLEQDISRAAWELREERRIERLWSRGISRYLRQASRWPALIHNGKKPKELARFRIRGVTQRFTLLPQSDDHSC